MPTSALRERILAGVASLRESCCGVGGRGIQRGIKKRLHRPVLPRRVTLRVERGSAEARVAEQFLYVAQVAPGIERVVGISVT